MFQFINIYGLIYSPKIYLKIIPLSLYYVDAKSVYKPEQMEMLFKALPAEGIAM